MIDDERIWRLVDLPLEELDALPFGAVVVDYTGAIVAYNDYESRMSRQAAAGVIGKNFFHDVAPCTAVKGFEGRMQAFVKSTEIVSETFDYFFPFVHGPVDVTITFVRMTGKKEILIAVERVDRKPAADDPFRL
jgi:photoactive yellow protein